MNAQEFARQCGFDRGFTPWTGDLRLLAAGWPAAAAFQPATVEIVDGVAVISFGEIVTATGWRQLADVVEAAVENPNVASVMLLIGVRACQAEGAAACCKRIGKLADRKPIVAQVEKFCLGAASLLLTVCTERYASADAQIGKLNLAATSPLDAAANN